MHRTRSTFKRSPFKHLFVVVNQLIKRTMNVYFTFRQLRRIEVFVRVHSELRFRGPQQRLSDSSDGSFRFSDYTIYREGKTTYLRARKSFTAGRFKRHSALHKSKCDRPLLQQFRGNRLLLAPVLANEGRR